MRWSQKPCIITPMRKRASSYKRYEKKYFIKRHKFLFLGLGFLAVLIIASGILFWVMKNRPARQIEYDEMTDATLPVLTISYENMQLNKMMGHTRDMNPRYMRDTIFVLQNTYDIHLEGQSYGIDLTNVRCKVYDTAENKLIQDTDAKAFEVTDTRLSIDLTLDKSMEEGKEYVLDVILEENGGRHIHYYTRVTRNVTDKVYGQIDLVLQFNNSLYSPNGDEFIKPYMESDGLKDGNRNLGHASLVSSLSHIMWGDMDVSKVTEPVVNIIDADGEIGFFRLEYMVSRVNSADATEYYNVSEYYRLRTTSSRTYVLDYERSVDQMFIPSVDNVGTTMAELGIRNEYTVEMMSNYKGTLNCFVTNGSLWCMDTETKSIIQIFSFFKSVLDERETYDRHDIKIISVSDEGDIKFLVYGYMNKGVHEGMTGLGLYKYNAEERQVNEEMFIPADVPFEILDQSIGSLCYLNNDNVLYLMMDEYLYAISLNDNDAELIASGLTESNSKISATGRMLAWHENGKPNTAERITVLDMETGDSYEVTAEKGKCIKALGFLNMDFVYGQGTSGATYVTAEGREYLLMPEMIVTNKSGKVQQRTQSDYGYFVDSLVEYNRVIISRVVKSGDSYNETDDFTLFATDLEDYPEPSLYISYEETKKSVYYVRYVDNTTTAGDLRIDKSIPVYQSNAEVTSVSEMLAVDGRYYVYAKGMLQGIVNSPAAAIQLAYENGGSVLTNSGGYFYRRSTRPSVIDVSEESMKQAIAAYKNEELLNVTGITLTEALYFTGSKIPVVWEYDGDVYVLQGYDVSDNIYLMNIETNEYLILTENYMSGIFVESGRCFVME